MDNAKPIEFHDGPTHWKERWLIVSAGVILALTGVAKLLGTTGDASILRVHDPIFGKRTVNCLG